MGKPSTSPSMHKAMVILWRDGCEGTAYTANGNGNTVSEPISPETLTDAPALLAWCARRFPSGEGTVIVPRPPGRVFDDGNHPAQLAEFAEAAKLAGWSAGAGVELGKGWVTFYTDARAVHLGIRSMIDDDPLVSAIEDPRMLVRSLAVASRLWGAPYRATPGVAGLAALRAIYDTPRPVRRDGKTAWVRRDQPKWVWNPPVEMYGWGSGHLIWQREPTPAELAMGHVIALDTKAAYLAAAAGATLAWDAPKHTGAVTWDPSMGGFFRALIRGTMFELFALEDAAGPPLLNPNHFEHDGTMWITTATMKELDARTGTAPDVWDSYTAHGRQTILRQWAEQIRNALPDARTAGYPQVRETGKRVYSEAVGLMAAPGGRVSRRDWHATVIEESRVRAVRKSDQAIKLGYVPLKVKTDCFWYASPDGDPDPILRALGQDPEAPIHIGHFKLDKDKCMTMAEWLAEGHRG